jgi:hypothetical protein
VNESEYFRQHRNPEVRAQAIRQLETLAERYPMLRLGQILLNATTGRDLYNLEDDELARMLDQLGITYHQFTAAGAKKEQLK